MGKKRNAGFSLVELIIVIAIMAALVGIMAAQYIKYVEKSRSAVCSTNMNEAANSYNIEMIFDEHGDPKELMDSVMTGLGAEVGADQTYKKLCPSGGTVTLVINADKSVTLTCSKHSGNMAAGFTSTLITRMLASDTDLKRRAGGKDQTLAAYLYNDGKYGKVIDSESTPNAKGADVSFTSLITEKMADIVPSGQSWRLSMESGKFVLYVTADGKLTMEDYGTKDVNAVKYVYSGDGVLESKAAVKVSVGKATNNKVDYPRITP